MLRSRANALLSVRRVTEVNAGRMTAGVDGETVVTAPGRPLWPNGCAAVAKAGLPDPSSGCTSRRRTGNSARSGYP